MVCVLISAPSFLFAHDCTIAGFQKASEWKERFYPMAELLLIAKYQCANIVLRVNTGPGKIRGDIVVRVIFSDGNFDAKRIDRDRKRIGLSETYSRFVCFQSTVPIEDIRCEFEKT